MATKKQKAAARRNIKKAHAANRKRKGGKRTKSRRAPRATKTSTKKLKSVRRHLRAAAKNLKHAHAIL